MDLHSGTVVLRPPVEGVAEVFHTHMLGHSYPMHAHAHWALMLVDSGTVRYELGRTSHGAADRAITLLPPHVPHNGTPVSEQGLRKRVLYLEPELVGSAFTGRSVDRPAIEDPLLRHRVHQLDQALTRAGEEFEAESRLGLVCERLRSHLSGQERAAPADDPGLAGLLRDLLEARVVEGMTLREASEVLHAHPNHLVRVFTRRFGTAPHQYLVGRRVDLARRLLSEGTAPKDAAAAAGFHDQPHLNRHFTRVLGIAPGRYVRALSRADGRP